MNVRQTQTKLTPKDIKIESSKYKNSHSEGMHEIYNFNDDNGKQGK